MGFLLYWNISFFWLEAEVFWMLLQSQVTSSLPTSKATRFQSKELLIHSSVGSGDGSGLSHKIRICVAYPGYFHIFYLFCQVQPSRVNSRNLSTPASDCQSYRRIPIIAQIHFDSGVFFDSSEARYSLYGTCCIPFCGQSAQDVADQCRDSASFERLC